MLNLQWKARAPINSIGGRPSSCSPSARAHVALAKLKNRPASERGEVTPQAAQTAFAPGSMEWLAAKNKSS
jgi:hypothetical protein